MKTIILAVLLLLVAVILLGVKVLFIKGATFPSGHAGHSAALRKRGIGCASADEPITNTYKNQKHHNNQ